MGKSEKNPKIPAGKLEELIELVRRQVCLHDPTSADHLDAVKTVNIWTSIAKVLKITEMVDKSPLHDIK